MPIEDIAGLPIEAHAQEHAVLFLRCPAALTIGRQRALLSWC